MKTSERFALNQWLSDYPDNMTYDEIIDLMHGDDENWTHDLITKWEVVEHFTLRQVIQFIDDTRKAFERTTMTHNLKLISSLLNPAYENLLSDDFDHDFVVGCVAEAKEIAETSNAYIKLTETMKEANHDPKNI